MCVCGYVCVAVSLSICLSICLSIYLSVYLSVYLCLCLCMFACVCVCVVVFIYFFLFMYEGYVNIPFESFECDLYNILNVYVCMYLHIIRTSNNCVWTGMPIQCGMQIIRGD